MSIETQIKEWTGKGLISAAQANQILEFERAKPKANWVLRGFLSLGIIVLGIGVISLIAANWEAIPDSLKLLGNFLILAGVAFLTFRYYQQNKSLGADITGLFFALLCLASIGLISQVFHTGGQLYEAFLFWNLITLPLFLFSGLKLSALLWTGAFFVSWAWWGYDHRMFGENIRYSEIFYLVFIPFVSAGLAAVTGFFTQLRTFLFSFRFAYFVSTVSFLAVFNILPYQRHVPEAPNFLFYALVAGSILISIFSLQIQRVALRRQLLRTAVLVLLAFLVFVGTRHLLTAFQVAALTLLFCLASAMEAGARKEKGSFNFWTFAAGFRFLILYFEALRGLAITGLGLIFSGALIIGTALLWNKYRAWMFKKAEEWVA